MQYSASDNNDSVRDVTVAKGNQRYIFLGFDGSCAVVAHLVRCCCRRRLLLFLLQLLLLLSVDGPPSSSFGPTISLLFVEEVSSFASILSKRANREI